jgi:antimicrobial peptide system SdpA family protein
MSPVGHTKVVVAACIAAAWGGIFFFVLVHSLPYNPIGGAVPDRIGIRTFIPEGWAFFTKSPRERQFEVFVEQGGRWGPALQTPVARPVNWFGLNRAARAQGVELGLLLQHVPESAWSPCSGADQECLRTRASELEIPNLSPRQRLCGRIGVVLREPVPWAWRSSRNRVHMPALTAHFTVQCS